jgi:O-antigen/teichoic acid export membrane protein
VTGPEQVRSYAVSLRDERGRWFAYGTALTALLSLPTQFLVEHGLGVEGYAEWLLVNSLIVFFVPIATLGYTNLILSEFFEGHLNEASGRRALRRFFTTTTIVAVAAFALVYGFGPFTGVRSWTKVAMGALMVAILSPVNLVYPVFQIQQMARTVALWPAMMNLNRFLVAGATLVASMSVTSYLGWWFASSVLLFAYALSRPGLFTLPEIRVRRELPEGAATSLTQRGVRFGAAEYLDSLDLKLAIPVTAAMLTAKQIAAAGLGLLFLNAVYFFPWMIVTRYLLPAIHSRIGDDRVTVQATIRRWLLLGAGAVVACGFAFALVGDRIVKLLAEGDYGDQGYLFQIVGVSMIPLCVSILASAPFMRVEHTRRLLTWRIQSTLAFLLVTFATIQMGAAAPMLGILAARAYLLIRFLFANRSDMEAGIVGA